MAEEIEPTPEGSIAAEGLGPRDNFVTSENIINFDYSAGGLLVDGVSFAIIAVSEVDSRLLVAVPESAWHRTVSKRLLPRGALQKAVCVIVPVCGDDRSVPQAGDQQKVWLGLLKEDLEEQVQYDLQEYDVGFGTGEEGYMLLPFARALVAVAKDHFTFLSAESAGMAVAGEGAGLEQRLAALEKTLHTVSESLRVLQAPPARPPSHAVKATAKPKPVQGTPVKFAPPPGLDASVAVQAMQAGVSGLALQEIAEVVGVSPDARRQGQVPSAVQAEVVDGEEMSEEEEDPSGLAAPPDGGSLDPVSNAVVQLTKIMGHLHREKVKQKDRSLEAILDRAESGSTKEIGVSRSKASALRSLRKMLSERPELIYTAIESNLKTDWDASGSAPGLGTASASARGWLEHRSKIQAFPATIRAAWLIGGIWDCLRNNRVAEARARAALATACLDQQSCDRGNWLVASEVVLEEPPPFHSFSLHRAPDVWETPHSRLLDGRWYELYLAKLKDLAEVQEKRLKLAGRKIQQEDLNPPTVKPDAPKKGAKGKGKTKEKTEETPTSSGA